MPVDIPTLLIVVAGELVEVVADILADIVIIKLEQLRDTYRVRRLNLGHQGILDLLDAVHTLKGVGILLTKRPQLLGLHMEDTADLATLNPQGVKHVATGIGNGTADGHQVSEIILQVIKGQIAKVGDIVPHTLPVDTAETAQVEQLLQVIDDDQEMQVLERETAIRTYRLEYHAKLLDLLGGLEKVRPPINGLIGMLDHHRGDIENLGHDTLGDHLTDMLVVPVLLGTEGKLILQRETIQILGGENTGSGNLGSTVMVKDLSPTLTGKLLLSQLNAHGSIHLRCCLNVKIDAIGLSTGNKGYQ